MSTLRRAALFDLDGVLIDSESTYTLFWASIEETYPTGIPDFPVAIKGTTLQEILKHYPDEAVRAEICRRLLDFQDSMVFSLYDGVAELLADLKTHGVPAAIVTSSDESKMTRLFGQHPTLRHCFDAVIDASKVTRSKPDPQGYLLAAQTLGVDPRHCFVFEDSLQGLRAGRASGATVVGLTTTYPQSAVEPLADIVVSSLAEFSVEMILGRPID